MTGAQALLSAPVSTAFLPNIMPERKLPSMGQSGVATVPYRFRGGKVSRPREKYYKELSLFRDTFALILETLSKSKQQVIILC